MDRNTTLAFALSMLVFVGYVMYQEGQRAELQLAAQQQQELALESDSDDSVELDRDDFPEADARGRINQAPQVARRVEERRPEVPFTPNTPAIALSTVVLENDSIIARVSNGPGMIESWRLRDFEEFVDDGGVPIELVDADHPVLQTQIRGIPGEDFSGLRYETVHQSSREVVQRAQSSAGILTRTFRLDEHGFGFDVDLEFESHRTDPVDVAFEVVWPTQVTDREDFRELSVLAYGEETGVTRTLVPAVGQPAFLSFLGAGSGIDNGVETVEGRSAWAGVDVQYFVGVIIDPEPKPRLRVQFAPLEEKTSAEVRVTLPSLALSPGASAKESLRGFIGPKTTDALAEAGSGLKYSVNRGFSWLEPLTRFFEIALDKLYLFIPNYGLAIIVLTILVRICTAPLMAKQMRSAERMRALQPRMKELQEKYKDDRQKQSEETMKLYREEKVNPIAGCLPLLLQFPVLIGLFYALRSSIGLRHAPFALWITDLSQPATLFVMPGIDFPIRLLPLVMGASMFVQQKMTPTTGMDPTQARMMLIMMPAMMLFISYTFPSGLVLYWTVSNLLGIAQQYWIRKQTQQAS
ncbi:MAG: membrane protein insertase YidC [Myxococcales bacterium]|nr:membrane protein insertase YidC [Myxococcales bacterium]HIK85068.1 membrane protein insertase YidC [Myxococcales bacterium]